MKKISNNTYVSLVYEDSVSASDREDMHQRDAKIRLSGAIETQFKKKFSESGPAALGLIFRDPRSGYDPHMSMASGCSELRV